MQQPLDQRFHLFGQIETLGEGYFLIEGEIVDLLLSACHKRRLAHEQLVE